MRQEASIQMHPLSIRAFGPALAALAYAAHLGAAATGEIRGIAWDAEGRPVAGATISLRGPSAKNVTTARDGSFTIANLEPGHYQVSGLDDARRTITETSVPVDIADGASIHADITIARGTRHYSFFKRMMRRLDGISQ